MPMSLQGAGLSSERRVVAVLFADIAGFTAMSERLDAETVTDVMNEIFGVLGAEVEAVGGHVDKVIGDSLMALFGAPVAHEDDALRAVRAALNMQRAMRAREAALTRSFGQPPRLRIGIHAGQVVWGVVGPPGQAHQTVMGDVVNLASRLQRAAPEGGVLVSDQVWRQVRGHYLSKTWEPLLVKGKAEPVAVYEVLGERDRAEPMARPPFVDRVQDLEQLEDLFTRARRGRAQVVVVIGDPGVGKTRLVEEFTNRATDEIALLQTSCPPYGGQSLGPLADLFRQLAGLAGPLTVKDVEARIPLGERAAQAAMILSRLFGLAEVPPGDEVSHDTALLVAAESIRRMILKPTIVWIEDLQWADPGTRELLPFIMERLQEAPLLLIANLRAGEDPATWGRRTAVTTMQLDPLSDDDARALLREILGGGLPDTVERALIAKGGGNPFYLNEIVATLGSHGTLSRDDTGKWRVTGSVEQVLPDTIHGALLARLDRLAPDLRGLVQRAAVVGSSFHQSLLAALSPETDVAEALRQMEAAYIVRRFDALAADPEFTFTHPLLREVAYGSLLLKHQAVLHAQIAEAMERFHSTRGEELAKAIGTHYDLAGRPRQALPFLLEAGREAVRRYATNEAIDLLERARTLAEENGETALCVEACEALGDLYPRVQGHGPKKWFDVWNYVVTHIDPAADPAKAARAAIRAASARAADNEPAEAHRYLAQAARLISAEDSLGSDFHIALAQTLTVESRYREALDAARTAVEMADRRGVLSDRARAYNMLAHPALLPLLGEDGRRVMREWVAEVEGTGDERLLIDAVFSYTSEVWTRGIVSDDILRRLEDSFRNTREYGWTADELDHHVILGWARFLLGQWQESGAHLHLAHDLVEEHGGRFQHWAFMIILPYALGNLAMASGRLEEAREIFEKGLARPQFHAPIWLNHGLAQCQWMLGDAATARTSMERSLHARDRFRCIICGCQANGIAAEFFATLGDVDLAEALAREAEDTALEIGHVTTRIRVLRARARLAMATGAADRAVALAHQAVMLGATLPLLQPYEHGQSLMLLGSAQQAAGQADLAAASWREARSLFERLGAAWHLRQVEEVIE